VVLMEDGRVTESGRHEDLLRDSAAYLRVVTRSMDAPVEEVAAHEHSPA
jgi:ABC-type multidrug transport system fused ATPase/permease subunit